MRVTTSLGRSARAVLAHLLAIALVASSLATQVNAQLLDWVNGGGAGTGAYETDANWSGGVAPGVTNAARINGGGTAIISASGTVGALIAGTDVATSGNFQLDSGEFTSLSATAEIATAADSSGSLTLNGGILNIGDVAGLTGLQPNTGSEDLLFSATANTNSTLTLTNNAQLRGVDDLTLGNHNFSGPVGAGATSNTTVNASGDSSISFADGFSTRGQLEFNLSGNAEASFGNSLGPADPNGLHKVGGGFVNLGSRFGSQADIVLEDNSVFNGQRLQNNQGTSSITVRDNAEFNVFNVGAGGTNEDFRGQAYLSRQTNSTNGQSSTIITLEGSGRFFVDVNPVTVNEDGTDGHIDLLPQAGLTLAGGDDEPVQTAPGNQGGNNNEGGIVVVDIKDSGQFVIVQDLWATYGTAATSTSTVKVTGPDATVDIGGDLYLAKFIDQGLIGTPETGTVVNNGLQNRPGTAALHSVITGSTHSVIEVGDEAYIDNGDLIVELDGYNPVLGDSYTLLTTGNSSGVLGEFADVDLSLAPLSGGLIWDLEYNSASVVLSVVPEPSSILLMVSAAACLLGGNRRRS